MRWSALFVPTLRNDPAEAEAVSHRLLLRAGYVRPLSAGHYSLLPLAVRVRRKIADIIREEMDRIGGQEFFLPAMHPADLWRRSGRHDLMGDNMFRLTDRKGAENVLGMTHEEVITHLAGELSSYRDLPQIWYQLQTKFRDEPRPKAGLLRVREFTMKDAYSFDLDAAGLDRSFDLHYQAYQRIFARIGLEAVPVVASSGAMGGSTSIEFMSRSEAGEDDVVHCAACGYSANVERATSRLEPIDDGPEPVDGSGPPPERFPTPGIRTIAALAEMEGGAAADRQVKTLLYVLDGQLTLVLLRGDHQLVEQKLLDATGAVQARPAHEDEIVAALGAHPGSLGAVGVTGHPVIADEALRGRREMTTGANADDWHLRHVDVGRDIEVGRWADLREAVAGEACPTCGAELGVFKAIEIGHIFKLGYKYSEAFELSVLDAEGESRVPIMGCYGIGVERNLAAVVEASNDDKGIVWPISVAPFEVALALLKPDDPASVRAAESLAADLEAAGVELVIDDRDLRPGAKLTDIELVGIPFRVTIGPKGLADGVLELTTRRSGDTERIPLEGASQVVADRVAAAHRALLDRAAELTG